MQVRLYSARGKIYAGPEQPTSEAIYETVVCLSLGPRGIASVLQNRSDAYR